MESAKTIDTVEIPEEHRERIEALEREFRAVEQQLIAAQLAVANCRAQFRILELEALADLGLSPRQFRVDRVGEELRIIPREEERCP